MSEPTRLHTVLVISPASGDEKSRVQVKKSKFHLVQVKLSTV